MQINPQMQMLIQMMRSGGNPQEAIMSMFGQQAQSNPVMANILTLAQQGKGADIEKIARNILSSQGFDFDKEFGDFKKMMGF